MVELYVIVHPECFNDFDIDGTIQDKKNKLKKVINERAYLIIKGLQSDNAEELSQYMPAPHENLDVVVVGAYYKSKTNRDWCLDNQLRTLRNRGYNARIEKELSLPDIT